MCMQLTYRYLATNKSVLIADLTNNITEYRPVYARNMTVYRGIDNVLTFEIKNPDQKPVSILNTYKPYFVMFDENNTQIIEREGTIKETSTPSFKGQFTVTVTENDLLSLKSQFAAYNVYLVATSDSAKTLTYANTHYNAKGTIEIKGDAFPGPTDTYSIKTFTETGVNTDIFTSETISGQPAINGNEALHTAAIYSTDFVGEVFIEGTLDNTVTGSTKFGDIAKVNLTNTTQPNYINFNGVFNHLRVRYVKTSGTIDKVLLRK